MAKYDTRLKTLAKRIPARPFDFEILIENLDGTYTGEDGTIYTEADLDHELTMTLGDTESIAGAVRKWKNGELSGRAKGLITAFKTT